MENAQWVLEGTRKGLHEIFPSRFAADGTPVETCVDVDGKMHWDVTACTAFIDAYKTAKGVPTPLWTLEELLTAPIECYTSNDAGLAKLTGKDACELKPFENGLF